MKTPSRWWFARTGQEKRALSVAEEALRAKSNCIGAAFANQGAAGTHHKPVGDCRRGNGGQVPKLVSAGWTCREKDGAYGPHSHAWAVPDGSSPIGMRLATLEASRPPPDHLYDCSRCCNWEDVSPARPTSINDRTQHANRCPGLPARLRF